MSLCVVISHLMPRRTKKSSLHSSLRDNFGTSAHAHTIAATIQIRAA